MPEIWFAVELDTTEGETFYSIHRSVEDLATYVRVNGGDIAAMKISAVEPSSLAQSRIVETFCD